MRYVKRCKILALFLCLALLPFQIPKVRADDSDIFAVNVQPNIMIFLDDSGSMSDVIYMNPWSGATTYDVVAPMNYDKDHVYTCCNYVWDPDYTPYPWNPTYHWRAVYTVYKTWAQIQSLNFTDPSWDCCGYYPNGPVAPILQDKGYAYGYINGNYVYLYWGNYLNWLFGPGTQTMTKIAIAQQVVKNIVTAITGVRFGLSTFNYGASDYLGNNGLPDGARILAEVGSSASTISAAVDTLQAYGYTPEGEALRDLGKYFKGDLYNHNGGTKYASPIQYSCQPNFIIAVTDGMWNGSLDIKPQATNLYTQDYAPSIPGVQNIIVDFVGYGAGAGSGTQAADEMIQAAKNGGGDFYTADTLAGLESVLQAAIRRAIQYTFTVATPVFPTTNATGTKRAYIASVQSVQNTPLWQGFLKAYDLDNTGNVRVDGNGVPLPQYMAWDAGAQLINQAWDARTIYTLVGASRVNFDTSLAPSLFGVTTTSDRDSIVQFTRGWDPTLSQPRPWKLGDIYHSTPVLVTPPILASTDPTYVAFQAANQNRTTVLIATANDGMVHAFKEADGTELWAFIPPDMLGKLHSLTSATGDKVYSLDSSPIAADVKIGGAWKTIVVFGERRGGGYYHALDITDTTNPQYLWGFTDARITESWSEPVIGKIQVNDSGNISDKYVAIFGGGFNTYQNNQSGKAVMAVDASNGQKIWQYYNNSSSDDRQYMNFSIPGSPLAITLNPSGYLDRLYVGDIGGQLWKFDLSGGVAPGAHTASTMSGGIITSWTGKRVFRAASDVADPNPPAIGEYYATQAIYGTPEAATDSRTPARVWVFFGTGDRFHPNNNSANRFYGIIDGTMDSVTSMTNGSTLHESDLVDVTSTDGTPTNGWYVRLGSNEKVLSSANVFNSAVLYSAYTPTTNVTCGGTGNARLYEVQMSTGYAAVDWANNGAVLTTSNSSIQRGTNIGQGIPGKPLVIMSDTGQALASSAVTGTTSQQISTNNVPSPTSLRNVLYWRERF